MERIKSFLVATLSMVWAVSSAASFYGISADGSEDSYQIGSVRSIKFEPQKAGDKGYRTLVFAEKSNELQSSQSASFVAVYPNPVSEYLTISGIEAEEEVAVTDMQGRVVSRTRGNKVDVSALSSGNYFLTVNNHSVKFIKK